MLSLTDNAIAAVRKVIAEEDHVRGLRIAVASGGCSGFRYMMGLESEEQDGDTILSFGDVTVFVDSDSLPLLSGTEVDFTDDLSGSGFTFNNPNATKSCGCGKSFC
jgi:iron-sulfur cluster assembly protein